MHRSYQSTLPTTNRLLKKKWDDKYYAEHKILVRDAKPMVDTRPPRTYMHLHLKLKKIQLEEERAATIERDNRILLEKMSTTMRTSGQVDNRNDYQAKSLNHEKRRRELLRVSQENSTMIQRITHRKAEMTTEDWKRDWSKNSSYLNNISKYPAGWFENPRTYRGATRTTFQSDDHRATSELRSRSAEPTVKIVPTSENPTETARQASGRSNTFRDKQSRKSSSKGTKNTETTSSEPKNVPPSSTETVETSENQPKNLPPSSTENVETSENPNVSPTKSQQGSRTTTPRTKNSKPSNTQ